VDGMLFETVLGRALLVERRNKLSSGRRSSRSLNLKGRIMSGELSKPEASFLILRKGQKSSSFKVSRGGKIPFKHPEKRGLLKIIGVRKRWIFRVLVEKGVFKRGHCPTWISKIRRTKKRGGRKIRHVRFWTMTGQRGKTREGCVQPSYLGGGEYASEDLNKGRV